MLISLSKCHVFFNFLLFGSLDSATSSNTYSLNLDSATTGSYTTISKPVIRCTKGTILGFQSTDLKSKLFKNPKIEEVIKKEGEGRFSIPIKIVYGDEGAADVPSELNPIPPLFLDIWSRSGLG